MGDAAGRQAAARERHQPSAIVSGSQHLPEGLSHRRGKYTPHRLRIGVLRGREVSEGVCDEIWLLGLGEIYL